MPHVAVILHSGRLFAAEIRCFPLDPLHCNLQTSLVHSINYKLQILSSCQTFSPQTAGPCLSSTGTMRQVVLARSIGSNKNLPD